MRALQDKCSLLTHQLKAYKDDFQKEREDRERLHQKLTDMEDKYKELKNVSSWKSPWTDMVIFHIQQKYGWLLKYHPYKEG